MPDKLAMNPPRRGLYQDVALEAYSGALWLPGGVQVGWGVSEVQQHSAVVHLRFAITGMPASGRVPNRERRLLVRIFRSGETNDDAPSY